MSGRADTTQGSEAHEWLPAKLRDEADYWGAVPTDPKLETAQPALARYLNEAADAIDALAARLAAAETERDGALYKVGEEIGHRMNAEDFLAAAVAEAARLRGVMSNQAAALEWIAAQDGHFEERPDAKALAASTAKQLRAALAPVRAADAATTSTERETAK